MMRTCRKKVQEVAETRWRKALREGKQQAFREAWLRTGAAYMMKGRELKVHALRCAESTSERQADAQGSAEIEMYCDGAWDPESGNFTAGAAAVEFDLRKAESPTPEASADATDESDSAAQLSDLDQTRNTSSKWYSLQQQKVTPKPPTRRGRLTWAVGTQVGTRGHERSTATKMTNNTGELLALLLAIRRATQRRNAPSKETIWVDSLYARNLTMGIWLPRRNTNIELVREVREAWRRCSIRRGVGTVRIQHVRSHTGVPGNELADQLADAAARGASEEPDLDLSFAERLMDKIEAESEEEGEEGERENEERQGGEEVTAGRGADIGSEQRQNG